MSLKCSASQVSPQVLSLLVLYQNIPDEPPKARFLMASLGFAGCVMRRGSFGLGDFVCWLTRARALRRSLFGHTLSERRGGCYSTPHEFAYCESSSERWVSSPAGQYLSSRPSSVITWDCVSTLTPARLSRAPCPDCDSPPWPLPGVSPSRRKACLSR